MLLLLHLATLRLPLLDGVALCLQLVDLAFKLPLVLLQLDDLRQKESMADSFIPTLDKLNPLQYPHTLNLTILSFAAHSFFQRLQKYQFAQ